MIDKITRTPGMDAGPSQKVLVITGATGAGKTDVAIRIAERLNSEVISADSRQIYRFMDIGTAKPTASDLRRVKHHFIDELSPDTDFNAGDFGKKGREVIADILASGKTPVVAGGSGLYIRALIDGFFDGPSADSSVRESLYLRLEKEGPLALHDELMKVDPASALRMLPSNTRRVIRALEVHILTGMPISQLQKSKIGGNFTPLFAGLDWERKKLYRRIDRRVDLMIERGLVDEAANLIRMGYSPTLNALQTVGYKEAFIYLDKKIDLPGMIDLIKRNSRRYAKRQLTWFRADGRIRWFTIDDEDEIPALSGAIMNCFGLL